MNFPHFMRSVNRNFTNPIMGTFAGVIPPLALVHHVGRKSGTAYTSPVVAFGGDTGFVIPLTYGRDVDWARNLLAADGGAVEQAGKRHTLHHPRIVGINEAYDRLPPIFRDVLRAADLPGYVLLDYRASARR